MDAVLSGDKPVTLAVSTTILLFFIAYLVSRCVYNLFFHPLSKFPGPKIAAIGSYYEFFYDAIKDGTYLWKIEEMHRAYGPIVRINAHELHIHDPEFYSKVYAGSNRRTNKYGPAVAAYTVPTATLATVDHSLHRLRRDILNPYFSKRTVLTLEPMINERVDRLLMHVDGAVESKGAIDFDAAFAALTADIVSFYFYGKDFGYLDSDGFKFAERDAITGLIGFYHIARFLPSLARFIKSMPIPIIKLLQPGTATLLISQVETKNQIKESLESDKETVMSDSVILGALRDPEIPAHEKTLDRLVDEGMTVIFAGTETTARALSVSLFHLLSNRSVLEKLREELRSATRNEDGNYSYTDLESLPYLTGCVREGLRLSHGPVIRLPRVSPDSALQYGEYLIPAGTPVSESTLLVHLDPSVFPNPKTYDPERWIRATAEGVHLSKYIASFTKGSRLCVGINLAYAELYLTLAKIASTFEMELFETTVEDTEVYRVRLTGLPKKGMGEIKARILSRVKQE